MTTENKIIGTVTVSAPFEKDWRTYYAEVVFNLHEDGQKSLRKQDVNDGLHIIRDQDFQEEAYALMHAWDTSELQIEVAELKRENAALRAQVKPLAKAVQDMKALIDDSKGVYGLHLNGDESPWDELTGDGYMSEWLGSLDIALAALSPQEAARG